MQSRFLLLTLLTLFGSPDGTASPVWRFSLLVAVEKQTAAFYQQQYGSDLPAIVDQQIARINATFNRAGNFAGRYEFYVDSLYVYEGDPEKEVFGPAFHQKYKLVISGFFDNRLGGGWYGSRRTIYHSWRWDYANGPFGQWATDGLTHELGHARGGVDIYAMQVDAEKNPVSGTAFRAVDCIMNYPYDNQTWSEYTTHLLNSTADRLVEGEDWITRPFPGKTGIRVVDNRGTPLEGISLSVYPVEWFSYAVRPEPVVRGSTGAAGLFTFAANPFQPGVQNYPWHIRYCNFLIKVVYNSVAVYQWMPLYEVQNAYFRHGPDSAYVQDVVLPLTAPGIQITSLDDSAYCQSDPITVSFTTTGTFEADNEFRLMLVDASGNSSELSWQRGTTGGTMRGHITQTSPDGGFSVRIVSSRAKVQSDPVPVNVLYTPPPTVAQNEVYLCQGETAQPLQATGTSLRWFYPDNTVSPTPPVPPTDRPRRLGYGVIQTGANGCRSYPAHIDVYVGTIPTLSVLGTTTVGLGRDVPLQLVFGKESYGPFRYRLSDGSTGTALRDTTVFVLPGRTTTYGATEVSNRCGFGTGGTQATITVLIPLLRTQPLTSSTGCAGDSLRVGFTTAGSFTENNVFRLQIAPVAADSAQARFVDLNTLRTGDEQLVGQLPPTLAGGVYWVRVMATNPRIPVYGTLSPTPLTVHPRPSARLTGGQSIFAGQTAPLTVAFTGNSPWTFTYRDSTSAVVQSVQTADNPYTLAVAPTRTTSYLLTSVTNGCGSGVVEGGSAVVRVEPVLGIEPTTADVFPIPTQAAVTVRLTGVAPPQTAELVVTDMAGRTLLHQTTNRPLSSLDLSPYPAGLYILRIRLADAPPAFRRLVKQ
mgnify:CR=1 FL=1